MEYEGDEYPSTMKDILKRGNTCLQNNRSKGIDIGCYDHQIDQLKYPLKLVSVSYKGTYEECPKKVTVIQIRDRNTSSYNQVFFIENLRFFNLSYLSE